ncbi:MAG: aquaporin family protein [Verrucomicrobiales bacterium]|nr:aquaporin family protein [Verrucomicrobiales bacterium]MCP5527611.1 aquaporin family protein [Verrucomicrobiales bacterium]
MSVYLAEFLGTMILVTLGEGVVANVSLAKSKGQNGGWIVVTAAWGLAVAMAVYAVGWVSGAHLNPAVTVAVAVIGDGGFGWNLVPGYLLAQFAGAFAGAILVWLTYLPHWAATTDPATKRGVFCTSPAIRQPAANLLAEAIGTAFLVLGVLAVLRPENLNPTTGWNVGLGPLLVGLIVFSIGLSLGGPTGYAINPARDLGPRLAHHFLPIAGKGGSDWGYAWVPVVGPLLGGVAGALVYRLLWPLAAPIIAEVTAAGG